MSLPGTTLDRGRVVPGAPLRNLATGDDVSAWSFRGRTALVLCFLHEGCDACSSFLRSLDSIEEDLRVAQAKVLAVSPDARATERFLGSAELPLVVIVDRDGAAWTSYPAPQHDFPDPKELAATAWHLATMCPECGVATSSE